MEGHTVKIIKGFECRELKVQTCPLLVSNVNLFGLWIHRYLARLAKGEKKTCTAGHKEHCQKQVTRITGCSPCSEATPLLSELCHSHRPKWLSAAIRFIPFNFSKSRKIAWTALTQLSLNGVLNVTGCEPLFCL